MILLYVAIVFGGGYYAGHETSTVTCRNEPLITTNCIDLQPPTDDSFGSTTVSLIEAVAANKRCKAACLVK